ncbi:MAG: hypothetical protein PHT54_00365 [Candidatus Nanoarchaeia archaeon]|nr:hypothetical protein [Candidatus Nanoarchaeia archaeon]
METKEAFIVNCSKESKSSDFVWFVRHKKIRDGKAVPVNRGSLEHYLTENRKKIM